MALLAFGNDTLSVFGKLKNLVNRSLCGSGMGSSGIVFRFLAASCQILIVCARLDFVIHRSSQRFANFISLSKEPTFGLLILSVIPLFSISLISAPT